MFSPIAESIVSTQLCAPSAAPMFSLSNSSKKKSCSIDTALMERDPDAVATADAFERAARFHREAAATLFGPETGSRLRRSASSARKTEQKSDTH